MPLWTHFGIVYLKTKGPFAPLFSGRGNFVLYEQNLSATENKYDGQMNQENLLHLIVPALSGRVILTQNAWGGLSCFIISLNQYKGGQIELHTAETKLINNRIDHWLKRGSSHALRRTKTRTKRNQFFGDPFRRKLLLLFFHGSLILYLSQTVFLSAPGKLDGPSHAAHAPPKTSVVFFTSDQTARNLRGTTQETS